MKSAFGLHNICFIPFHVKADKNNFTEQTRPETGKMSVHVATSVTCKIRRCRRTFVCFLLELVFPISYPAAAYSECMPPIPSLTGKSSSFVSATSQFVEGQCFPAFMWWVVELSEQLGKPNTNTVLIHANTVKDA